MSQTQFVPEQWLETAVRAIKDYTLAGLEAAVLDDTDQPVGDQVYEVTMEFPGPDIMDSKLLPLQKTLIHFEIDAITNDRLGFGDSVGQENYDNTTKTIRPQEAALHTINFDVGIWASDRSGGTSARLRARQVLTQLFHGVQAFEAMKNATNNDDGFVEILDFSGGSFITERVNDVNVYRQIDTTLVVRVFSRTPLSQSDEIQTIEEIDQASGLTVLG